MAAKINLSKVQAYFNEKSKIPIKGNVNVDVYMYYHALCLLNLKLKT